MSAKAVYIQFKTGSAYISPASEDQLEELYRSFAIADNLRIDLDGYTDNTGAADVNEQLSLDRANAVKQWFLDKDPNLFRNRINTYGHGPKDPLASNDTETGRAKNRRVEVKLGK